MVGFVAVPLELHAARVGLVCDGAFRTQVASVDSVAEDMFAGTMHVALVRDDGQLVEVRLQAFEGEIRMPVQTYAVPPLNPDDEQGAAMSPRAAAAPPHAERVAQMDDQPVDALEINVTDKAIILHQTVETGPMMRARVDGKPLVPTRQKVATVDMRLDRIDGSLKLVWSENVVKDHKVPGAIRASKVRLRDEKSYDARCLPVRQRAF